MISAVHAPPSLDLFVITVAIGAAVMSGMAFADLVAFLARKDSEPCNQST